MPEDYWDRQARKERRQQRIFWIVVAMTMVSGFFAVGVIYSGG